MGKPRVQLVKLSYLFFLLVRKLNVDTDSRYDIAYQVETK